MMTVALPTHASSNSRHALHPEALQHQHQLLVFNWRLATYAHRDWLGPWADLIEPRGGAQMGVLRRASSVLLERHGLLHRRLRSLDGLAWMLLPQPALHALAEELGVVMLGGWVRQGLERESVAQQLRVLGPERRASALHYASTLHALPFPTGDGVWPIDLLGSSSVIELGLSCLAALLSDGNDRHGAQQRFAMRFAQGQIVPLQLTQPQQEEAHALIARLTQAADPRGHS